MPAAIAVTPSTFTSWATMRLAVVLLLVTFSVKVTGISVPLLSVFCANDAVHVANAQSRSSFLNIMNEI